MSEPGSGEVEERIARLEPQDQQPAHAPIKSGRDRDAYAAVIASFIGLLALAVSGYTAYVQRQQLRAQVWPHLSVWRSDVNLGLYVTNQGTGPATIKATRVAVDDKPVKRWPDAMAAAGVTGNDWVMSTLSKTVLPSGKDFTILQAMDSDESRAKIKELIRGEKHTFSVMICYCSVLDDCWVARLPRDDDREDIPSGTCPIPVPERFND